MADPKPTLVRGPDEEMYFIPPERLAEFRVPDETAAQVEENLRTLREEGEVSGFSFDNPISPDTIGLDDMSGGDTVVDGSGQPMPVGDWAMVNSQR